MIDVATSWTMAKFSRDYILAQVNARPLTEVEAEPLYVGEQAVDQQWVIKRLSYFQLITAYACA